MTIGSATRSTRPEYRRQPRAPQRASKPELKRLPRGRSPGRQIRDHPVADQATPVSVSPPARPAPRRCPHPPTPIGTRARHRRPTSAVPIARGYRWLRRRTRQRSARRGRAARRRGPGSARVAAEADVAVDQQNRLPMTRSGQRLEDVAQQARSTAATGQSDRPSQSDRCLARVSPAERAARPIARAAARSIVEPVHICVTASSRTLRPGSVNPAGGIERPTSGAPAAAEPRRPHDGSNIARRRVPDRRDVPACNVPRVVPDHSARRARSPRGRRDEPANANTQATTAYASFPIDSPTFAPRNPKPSTTAYPRGEMVRSPVASGHR